MLSLLLWCVFGLILYLARIGFFWVMTASVIFGLVLGLLLLGSRSFAKLFFAIGKTSSSKNPLQARKVACFLGEMHDYFWGDKVQLLKLPVPPIWFFALAANLVLSSASERGHNSC